MKKTIKHTLMGGLLALILTGTIFTVQPTQNAQATDGSTISCGGATCSVASTVYARNTYAAVPPSATPAKDKTANGGSPYTYSYKPCSTWLPVGGGTSTRQYPKPDGAAQTCVFNDGGGQSAGNGYTLFNCPPKNGKSANGRMNAYFKTGEDAGQHAFYYCVYPTDASFYPTTGRGKFYTGGEGKFFKTANAQQASAYNSNGSLTDSTGYRRTNFSASNPAATSPLNQSFNAKTGKTASGQPIYGFYSLRWKLDYKVCTSRTYPAFMGYPQTWVCGAQQQETTAEPFTYSCQLNPALQRGINTAVSFSPSICNPAWSCDISPSIRVNGMEKGSTLQVMRSGEKLPMIHNNGRIPTVTGTAISAVNQWRYIDAVVAGSKPFNGTDPNSAKQYFTKLNSSGGADVFGKTLTLTQKAIEQTIQFYWASDSGSSWKMTRAYSFTATFNVPVQDSINGGTVIRPVEDSASCNGVAETPAVQVVRSVNK